MDEHKIGFSFVLVRFYDGKVVTTFEELFSLHDESESDTGMLVIVNQPLISNYLSYASGLDTRKGHLNKTGTTVHVCMYDGFMTHTVQKYCVFCAQVSLIHSPFVHIMPNYEAACDQIGRSFQTYFSLDIVTIIEQTNILYTI